MLPLILAGGAIAGNALGSYLQGQGEKAAAKANAKTMRDLANMQRQESTEAFNYAANQYNPYASAGKGGLAGLANWQGVAAPSEFQYSKTAQDFLDPSVAYQMQQLQQAQGAGAAAHGGLLSSGAQRQMQDLALKQAQTDYGNAYNRMTQDKASTYQQYMDYFNNQRLAANDQFNKFQSLANIGQNATANLANARQGMSAVNQGANATQMNAQNEYNQVRAAAPYSTKGNLASSLGQMAGTASAYAAMNPGALSGAAAQTPSGWDIAPPYWMMQEQSQPQQLPWNYGNYTRVRPT